MAPTLDSLPPEIRRQIVSYLVTTECRDGQRKMGSKEDLKNANAAHSCLRQWVPEFLFQEMELKFVVSNMMSKLERFRADPANSELWNYVKTVHIQVPPSLVLLNGRTYEHYMIDPGAVLGSLYHGLSADCEEWASNYHNALIEPFVNNGPSIHSLMEHACSRWPNILVLFPALKDLKVGICERLRFPPPTLTNNFARKSGIRELNDVGHLCVEQNPLHLDWASAVALYSTPPTVESLEISMATSVNLRLGSRNDRLVQYPREYRGSMYGIPSTLKSLTLHVRGDEDFYQDVVDFQYVRVGDPLSQWHQTLKDLRSLTHLTLHNVDTNIDVLGDGTPRLILETLLADLDLPNLDMLRLHSFITRSESLAALYNMQLPNVKKICLANMALIEPADVSGVQNGESQAEGHGWSSVLDAFSNDTSAIVCLHKCSSITDELEVFPIPHDFEERMHVEIYD